MQIGDLARFSHKGHPTIGIVTEKAGKYLILVDWDGQRYSMNQDYVELLCR